MALDKRDKTIGIQKRDIQQLVKYPDKSDIIKVLFLQIREKN